MSNHRRFCDGAGYTRHCWECRHATGWHKVDTIDGRSATCEVTGLAVGKYDSPNNPSCDLPLDCDYEEG